jgi:membrane-bound lytic murein transglycosylase B
LGIDIALIDALLAGEHEARRFEALVAHFRKRRFNQRLRDSEKTKGQAAYEQRERALQDLQTQTGV